MFFVFFFPKSQLLKIEFLVDNFMLGNTHMVWEMLGKDLNGILVIMQN